MNARSALSERHRRRTGPGRLTFAWLALAGLAAVAVGGLMMTNSQGTNEDALLLTIAPVPERFARAVERDVPVPLTQAGGAATQPVPEQQTEAPLPKVIAGTPEEQTAPATSSTLAETPAGQAKIITLGESENTREFTAEDLEAIANDGAKVIRIDDLPDTGSAAASGRAPARLPAISAAPPPPVSARLHQGKMPVIAKDGKKAAQFYRRTFSDPAGRPRISLIIGGLGLSSEMTRAAITELPPEISLAFAPYTRNLDQWAEDARRRGHETLLEIPLGSDRLAAEELGPAAILPEHSAAEKNKRLDWLLSRYRGYFAVTNFKGDGLAGSGQLRTVETRLAASGIGFITDNDLGYTPSHNGIAGGTTQLTWTASGGDITSRLQRLEGMAVAQGHVLVKIYPTQATIGQIRDWVAGLDDQKVVLAPASTVLD